MAKTVGKNINKNYLRNIIYRFLFIQNININKIKYLT